MCIFTDEETRFLVMYYFQNGVCAKHEEAKPEFKVHLRQILRTKNYGKKTKKKIFDNNRVAFEKETKV